MSETVTMTLPEFLLARIAEDESFARQCRDGDGWAPGTSGLFWADDPGGVMQVEPKRVREECEAKRRIVEMFSDSFGEPMNAQARWTLEALALPYADHPDYREEWRP